MIVLAATPIGNLGDASRRLVETLSNADGRRRGGHQDRHPPDARPRHREPSAAHRRCTSTTSGRRRAEVVELARDEDVVVLTDAGMPAISDPGFPLVEAAAAAGVTVTALPGPSAVLMALAVSGPADRPLHASRGSRPRKAGERRRVLRRRSPASSGRWSSSSRRTGWPRRSPTWPPAFGADRRAVVCRELTKLYEEVRRGPLAELVDVGGRGGPGRDLHRRRRAPRPRDEVSTSTTASRWCSSGVAAGTRMKEAAAAVADATGLSKRDLYEGALAAR